MADRARHQLPAGDLGDARLADQLARGECPLCRIRADAAERYLDAVLWESVNDVAFRARLARGRGFCRRHAGDVLTKSKTAGQLTGGAILLGASLRVRLAELDALVGRRSGARDVANARTPVNCPVCEQVAAAERSGSQTLLAKLEDPAWRAAIAGSEFCLDDLLLMWATAREQRTAAWTAVATAQLARIAELADRLEAFAHHSSFDRRHLQTDAERLAPDEAARFLGGSPAGATRSRG